MRSFAPMKQFFIAEYGWLIQTLARAFSTFITPIIHDTGLKNFRDAAWDPDVYVSIGVRNDIRITLDRVACALYFECPSEEVALGISQRVEGSVLRKRLVVAPIPQKFFSVIDQRSYSAA